MINQFVYIPSQRARHFRSVFPARESLLCCEDVGCSENTKTTLTIKRERIYYALLRAIAIASNMTVCDNTNPQTHAIAQEQTGTMYVAASMVEKLQIFSLNHVYT